MTMVKGFEDVSENELMEMSGAVAPLLAVGIGMGVRAVGAGLVSAGLQYAVTGKVDLVTVGIAMAGGAVTGGGSMVTALKMNAANVVKQTAAQTATSQVIGAAWSGAGTTTVVGLTQIRKSEEAKPKAVSGS